MTTAVSLAQSVAPGVSLGFKNRLINGAGQIWQRGTTISSIPTTGTSATYGPDRWCFGVANTGFTAIAQAVQVSGGGIRVNCTTAASYANAADVFTLRQIIEGLNCYDLAGQQVTVSFQVKTNKTGNYGVVIYDYTGSVFGTPQSITVSSSGVTTSYSLTFTAPSSITASTSAGLGLNITLAANTARAGSYYPSAGSQVNLMDSTSNYFEIYNVQLEVGTAATSFEFRDYGRELMLCQRYYFSTFASDGAVPTYNSCGSIVSSNQSEALGARTICTMRATPTYTIWNAATGASGTARFSGSNIGVSAVNGSTVNGFQSMSLSSSASTLGVGNYAFTASAEL